MAKRNKQIILANDADLSRDDSGDLLLRHEAFIDAYLRCFNGTQAWMIAHPDCDDVNTAAASASRLLRNDKVRVELERRFKSMTMGKNEVLARLMDIANASLHPFIRIDDDGYTYFNFADSEAKKHFHLIKKIKHRKSEIINERTGEIREEHWVEVELHDALKALELIGKYHALFTDKVDVTERRVIHVSIVDVDNA